QFRVLRDYAEPGAVRRIHSHDEATWHVFTLVTGQLTLTIDGEAPIEVTQGQVLSLKGGVKHTFKNTGTVAATIVEVFGKAAPPHRDPQAVQNVSPPLCTLMREKRSRRTYPRAPPPPSSLLSQSDTRTPDEP